LPNQKVLDRKKAEVQKLSERIKASKAIVLTEFSGLTVEQDTEMRRVLREAGIEYTVTKNSLIRFAIKGSDLDALEKYLEGPTAIATHNQDPAAPAKVLADFVKKYDKLNFKAGVVEGKVIGADDVKALATMPSREELIARTLAGFNAPIAGLVNVLNANLRGLAIVLNAISEKKSA
jgi:large subunit ribosomal protein L10